MRKLKYTLLFVMLVFGLNSCLTTMVGWGICEQYGCTPSPKKNGIEGVEIFAEENFLEFKSYFESLKKRETVMVKAGINETFNVNLPKNFILKKFDKIDYYLYDKEKKIGFFVIDPISTIASGISSKIFHLNILSSVPVRIFIVSGTTILFLAPT